MNSSNKRIILVAAMGTSPAVLTETIWALAHQPEPVLPDEIIVLITRSGKTRLCKELLRPSHGRSVWSELLAALRDEHLELEGKLVFGETSIRVIPDALGNEAHDLRSVEDNLLAADFMLSQVRQYTESPDTIVFASIAGGRKTLSALLFSCMSLLGRSEDKVFHVLLPPELEGGMEPSLYFPKKGTTYVSLATRKRIRGEKIRCELFEVPFVRMRGWYQDSFKTLPPSYRTLVERVQAAAPPAITYPKLEIDLLKGTVRINGVAAKLSRTCFALLVLLADGCPIRELYPRLVAMHANQTPTPCDWLVAFRESSRFALGGDIDDLRKTMSELRKKLAAAGFIQPDILVPQRNASVAFPLALIKWQNRSRLTDVYGHLAPLTHVRTNDRIGSSTTQPPHN